MLKRCLSYWIYPIPAQNKRFSSFHSDLFAPIDLFAEKNGDTSQRGGLCRRDLTVDTDKYYLLIIGLSEEIQISENELATDPDRHRSLSRHRRITDENTSKGLPRNGPYKSSLSFGKSSIFLGVGPAVMI